MQLLFLGHELYNTTAFCYSIYILNIYARLLLIIYIICCISDKSKGALNPLKYSFAKKNLSKMMCFNPPYYPHKI